MFSACRPGGAVMDSHRAFWKFRFSLFALSHDVNMIRNCSCWSNLLALHLDAQPIQSIDSASGGFELALLVLFLSIILVQSLSQECSGVFIMGVTVVFEVVPASGALEGSRADEWHADNKTLDPLM